MELLGHADAHALSCSRVGSGSLHILANKGVVVQVVRGALLIATAAQVVFCLGWNENRPIIRPRMNIFRTSSADLRLAGTDTNMAELLKLSYMVLPDEARVGLVLRDVDVCYPWFGPDLQRWCVFLPEREVLAEGVALADRMKLDALVICSDHRVQMPGGKEWVEVVCPVRFGVASLWFRRSQLASGELEIGIDPGTGAER